MPEPSSPAELAALHERWSREPTPQLALQLAEEYGRSRQFERAVEVLLEGLQQHPSHLSARVALGRYRLALGQLEEAAGELEQVAQRDPTHLVANKLLVKVYGRLGEPAKARDRLDLYRLLNESDPEIEELEREARGAAGEAPPAAEPEVAEVAAQAAPEPFGTPVTTAAPAPPAETPPAPPEVAPAAAGEARPSLPSRDEPFPGLWTSLDVDSYWREIDSDGIFALAGGFAPAQPAEVEPEPTPAVELEPEAVPGPAELRELPPPEAVAVPEPPAQRRSASITLAELYREQGHVEEAERTYRAVLESQPDNQEALAALAELTRGRTVPLTAGELLDEAALAAPLQERKRRLLESYLGRLRREGN